MKKTRTLGTSGIAPRDITLLRSLVALYKERLRDNWEFVPGEADVQLQDAEERSAGAGPFRIVLTSRTDTLGLWVLRRPVKAPLLLTMLNRISVRLDSLPARYRREPVAPAVPNQA
ncbi:hypothetical protein [Biformimicrobium ophioploci]|uniref:DUF721 domain-containing protein n=1 Tax=Biformimicrobium ophioploci TaxID=3036711 RepID=A0ABQ6M0U0_9GAMM|nr:hypothetical protein [Microbulbifer sp. NKW57]GMG87970.1 hypothetical protein MNKW57_22910 [Microbulbifer sp. NKW57]